MKKAAFFLMVSVMTAGIATAGFAQNNPAAPANPAHAVTAIKGEKETKAVKNDKEVKVVKKSVRVVEKAHHEKKTETK